MESILANMATAIVTAIIVQIAKRQATLMGKCIMVKAPYMLGCLALLVVGRAEN
jgi:hypothetical protein